MSSNACVPSGSHWMESSGIGQILRTFKIAIHPSKLLVALVAIFLTVIWGMLLDWVWTATDHGVTSDALVRHIAEEVSESGSSATSGVFDVFSRFELSCLRDAVESVRYLRIVGTVDAGKSLLVTTDVGDGFAVRGAASDLLLMGRGFVWLVVEHWCFAFLFLAVGLLIWAFCGGAICRMAAFQYARDESIPLRQSLRFAREKLVSGFFMAPVIPLLICLLVGVVLALGGVVLRIPWGIGDIIGGLFFFLAVIGGFVISIILVGTLFGASLFWPTVAVEGSDAFDAISRSFSYGFGHPIRTVWYSLLALVYGSFAWLFVKYVAWLAAASAYLFINFGSGGKLATMWARPTVDALFVMSQDVQPGANRVGAYLVGIVVLLLVGCVWAFLASFYFSASTAVYFLLRRDVDGSDLGDLFFEDDDSADATTGGESAVLETPAVDKVEPDSTPSVAETEQEPAESVSTATATTAPAVTEVQAPPSVETTPPPKPQPTEPETEPEPEPVKSESKPAATAPSAAAGSKKTSSSKRKSSKKKKAAKTSHPDRKRGGSSGDQSGDKPGA